MPLILCLQTSSLDKVLKPCGKHIKEILSIIRLERNWKVKPAFSDLIQPRSSCTGSRGWTQLEKLTSAIKYSGSVDVGKHGSTDLCHRHEIFLFLRMFFFFTVQLHLELHTNTRSQESPETPLNPQTCGRALGLTVSCKDELETSTEFTQRQRKRDTSHPS